MHQLAPLSNNEQFEDAICDLFNKIESITSFKRFGKNGHLQKGIDIFSTEKDCAIQCKKKDLSRKDVVLKKELLNDIEKDVRKALANKLAIRFERLIFVSTFKDHPDIDEFCEVLKSEWKTDFEINYWGWETLEKKFFGS